MLFYEVENYYENDWGGGGVIPVQMNQIDPITKLNLLNNKLIIIHTFCHEYNKVVLTMQDFKKEIYVHLDILYFTKFTRGYIGWSVP